MRFALTDDQLAVRDAVREVLAATCPPAVVRAAWPGSADRSALDRAWAALAGLGVPGMAVPEKAGGLGLTEVDLVPVLIEVGSAAVPLPVAETAAVAAPLLAAADHPGGPRAGALAGILAGVISGATRVALRTGDGPVAYAGRAHLLLDLTGGRARIGPPSGTAVSTVDGSRMALAVAGPPADLVTADAGLVALARDRADVATAAQLIGLSRRMLDMTVGYVRERHQFGVPVGSFQAVKHRLADALTGIEFAEPVVLAAAAALASGSRDRGRDVSAAVVLAVEAARSAARTAIQCHGAIGYTVEYDLHLYAKRAWALAATCDLDAHLGRIARALDLPEGVSLT
jgi:alkylation response protein AidB-like acyl-CoA dehydrogenase